jgi:hypothetical protein
MPEAIHLHKFAYSLSLFNAKHLIIDEINYNDLSYLTNLETIYINKYVGTKFPSLPKLKYLEIHETDFMIFFQRLKSLLRLKIFPGRRTNLHSKDFPSLINIVAENCNLHKFEKLVVVDLADCQIFNCKFRFVKDINLDDIKGSLYLHDNIDNVNVRHTWIRKITNPKYVIEYCKKIKKDYNVIPDRFCYTGNLFIKKLSKNYY